MSSVVNADVGMQPWSIRLGKDNPDPFVSVTGFLDSSRRQQIQTMSVCWYVGHPRLPSLSFLRYFCVTTVCSVWIRFDQAHSAISVHYMKIENGDWA